MTRSKTSHPISVYASMCTSVCVYLLGSCGYMLEQAQSLNISDCFSCPSLPLCVCVRVCDGVNVSCCYICVCLCVSGLCAVLFLHCPFPLMPCTVSRKHFIRPERTHHVPWTAGSASPWRISRIMQQHSAAAAQTLSLQQ